MTNSSDKKNDLQTGSVTTLGVGSTTKLVVDRGNWGSPLEFILACLGYAVGLGNVWRFPYLAYRNGGGAFLVPFLLMIFVIGLPIFFAELFIGQFSGVGPNKAYGRMAPLFKGLGYCTLIVITLVTIYYMVILAWILFYLFASFSPTLGWSTCDHTFNTDSCYSTIEDQICQKNNTGTNLDQIYYERKCQTVQAICSRFTLDGVNKSMCRNATMEIPIRSLIQRRLASEEFYYDRMLGLGNATWTDWGYPRWELVLCLLLAWIIAFFCVIKGIQSAGKVVYFTALFPYVILTALLIRGCTLPGAYEGIMFYMTPDWSRLQSPSVWADAASQIFYSFGIACSSLVTLASYNKFKNNIHFDACIVSCTNAFTAVYAGFAIFSILGFMAYNMDIPVSEVVTEGPGLAFIAYPEAVLLMPLPHLWAVLFFFMMYVLGLGSQIAGIEAITTAVIDQWPHLRSTHWKVTAGTCLFCFIAAIPMVCNGGVYLFTLMDWHTASWAILLIGFAEVVVISWVYGFDKAFDNIGEMGMKFNKLLRQYWWIMWVVLTPIFSLGLFIFTLTDIGPTEFRGYVFPAWADSLGWIIGTTTLLPFIVGAGYEIFVRKLKGMELLRPTKKWMSQETKSQIDGQSMTPPTSTHEN